MGCCLERIEMFSDAFACSDPNQAFSRLFFFSGIISIILKWRLEQGILALRVTKITHLNLMRIILCIVDQLANLIKALNTNKVLVDINQ